MTEDDILYRAWSFGINPADSGILVVLCQGLDKSFFDRDMQVLLQILRKTRTRGQMARYLVRNRRSYNHDLALIRLHERAVIRERSGMRCAGCAHIPPQPGEIMEEESNADIAGS
jgi:hypothetical protein